MFFKSKQNKAPKYKDLIERIEKIEHLLKLMCDVNTYNDDEEQKAQEKERILEAEAMEMLIMDIYVAV